MFTLGIEQSPNVEEALKQIKQVANIGEKTEVPVVPWFPVKLTDLDNSKQEYTKLI